MQTKIYFVVFVILILFSILFYLKTPHKLYKVINMGFLNKSNLKTHTEEIKPSKKVKFLNTGLERVIDDEGNITDKPIYIDVG